MRLTLLGPFSMHFSLAIVLDNKVFRWHPMQYLWPFVVIVGVCLIVLVVVGVSSIMDTFVNNILEGSAVGYTHIIMCTSE